MEHFLSDISMDHLVRFFEFLDTCKEGHGLLKKFHDYLALDMCTPRCDIFHQQKRNNMNVRKLKPGEKGRVARVEGSGPIRQRLLNMGIMSNVIVEMERISPAGDPVWIRFQGMQLSLRKKEAESIVLV